MANFQIYQYHINSKKFDGFSEPRSTKNAHLLKKLIIHQNLDVKIFPKKYLIITIFAKFLIAQNLDKPTF